MSAPRTVIINADDLGYDPGVTRGLLEAMARGIVTSATLMVNTPHSAAAASACPRSAAVGLHLNLARWRPLSPVPAALLGADGAFVEARVGELAPAHVEAEALAQLDRLRALLGRPATHLDVHKHLHRHPRVLEGVIAAARARALPVRSMDEASRAALRAAGLKTNDVMLGEAGTEAYWTQDRLVEALGALPPVQVVELMCHPGYRPEAERSGYAAQREVELATFTSARSLALARSLPLGDWRSV